MHCGPILLNHHPHFPLKESGAEKLHLMAPQGTFLSRNYFLIEGSFHTTSTHQIGLIHVLYHALQLSSCCSSTSPPLFILDLPLTPLRGIQPTPETATSSSAGSSKWVPGSDVRLFFKAILADIGCSLAVLNRPTIGEAPHYRTNVILFIFWTSRGLVVAWWDCWIKETSQSCLEGSWVLNFVGRLLVAPEVSLCTIISTNGVHQIRSTAGVRGAPDQKHWYCNRFESESHSDSVGRMDSFGWHLWWWRWRVQQWWWQIIA